MIYVSGDIETTGLEPENNDVVEIALVVEDTSKLDVPIEDLPTFHCLVLKPIYKGNPYALSLHADKFRAIADVNKKLSSVPIIKEEDVAYEMFRFLINTRAFELYDEYQEQLRTGVEMKYKFDSVKIVAGGKNIASFDKPFLETLPEFKRLIKFHHRFVDPTNMFIDFDKQFPPSLDEIIDMIGRDKLKYSVTHNAVDDARSVIEVIRWKIQHDYWIKKHGMEFSK